MRSRWLSAGAVAGALALAGACSAPVESPPSDPSSDSPPLRTNWVLRHQIVGSGELRVRGFSIGQYDESTSVDVGRDAEGFDRGCSVSVSVPGRGGPESKVGEKLPTQVQGRPGFRNGAGAEFTYITWQLPDQAWVEASCSDPEELAPVEALAGAVRMKKTSIPLPYAVDLPDGYEVSSISQEVDANTKVYVGAVNAAFGLPDSDIEISYETKDPLHTPSGRAITVGGHPALLNDNEKSPEVCVLNGSRHVCVDAYTTDTGPYPDRRGEIPTLIAIAASLHFADDLEDRTTWFPAERVFG